MLYVILSALCSVALNIVFKFFKQYNVETFQAIVVNYFTCVLTAWVVSGVFPLTPSVTQVAGFPHSVVLGSLFIIGFYFVGISVQVLGVATSAILQKMSVLVTILVAVAFYHEPLGVLKTFGIIAALASIVLTNIRPTEANADKSVQKTALLIAITLFVLSGVCDAGVFVVNKMAQGATSDLRLVAVIFGTAGFWGALVWLVQWARGKVAPSVQSLVAGVALGVPNYFSIYFFMKALSAGIDGSVVFPTANVLVIFILTLAAFFFFKEKLSLLNWLGIAAALLSIVLIALA